MTFIYPDITKDNRRCVYKLFFEDGSFYIGSTNNLSVRISGYKQAFKNSIGSVNKLIAAKSEIFTTIWFEVLEIVPLNVHPKEAEHAHIIKNSSNPLLLNRTRSAFNNSGMIKSR